QEYQSSSGDQIVGVIVTDDAGFCVKAVGKIPKSAAGIVTSISDYADGLVDADADDEATYPMTVIEADDVTIVIKRVGNIDQGNCFNIGILKQQVPRVAKPESTTDQESTLAFD
ncbi:hypothetical protein EV182_004604, partial [Spiromyces aspiralis]